MIINNPRLLEFSPAPFKRNDYLSVPLIVPVVPMQQFGRQINGVNFPVKMQGYAFPGSYYVPYNLPATPMPVVSPINTPSYVNQSSGNGQIGPSNMQKYLQGYLGR